MHYHSVHFTRKENKFKYFISEENPCPNPIWLHSYLLLGRYTHTHDIYIYIPDLLLCLLCFHQNSHFSFLISHFSFVFFLLSLISRN